MVKSGSTAVFSDEVSVGECKDSLRIVHYTGLMESEVIGVVVLPLLLRRPRVYAVGVQRE